MLPSTGYFKSINCPFYETGCCDRPYCHFKHLRRDDSTSSMASVALPAAQVQSTETIEKTTTAVATAGVGAGIRDLVNEAVKKLLETQDVTDEESMTNKIVARVVEQLKPTIDKTPKPAATVVPLVEPIVPSAIGKHVGVPGCVTKPAPCVYNPTPIAELKKRHIPVPVYMPTRESKVAVKRKSSIEATTKPWPSMLRESTNSRSSELTYKPTAIASSVQEPDSSKTYVPTLRSDNSSSNSYDDGNSNDYMPKAKEAYYPKSKKRREEYVPKKVKAPLKSVRALEESALDEFEPEFDMIDEILASATTNPDIEACEDTQDLYDIEPKFSDDEEDEEEDEVEEVMVDESSTKEVQKTELRTIQNDLDVKENTDDVKDDDNRTSKSKTHSSSSSQISATSRGDDKLSNKDIIGGNDRRDESRRNSTTDGRREKDKKKDRGDSHKSESKRDSDKSNKKDRRSERSHEKNKKDENEKSSECKDKNKSSNASTRDKHRSSSSSKDRARSKDSHSSENKKESSSHRSSSKDATRSSHKDKVPSSKSDDGKSRSSKSRHDKHSSSSSRSRSEKKGESSKNSEKHSSRSSSHKSSSSRKKSSGKKESSSETSVVEIEEHSNSPFENNFIDEELMEISDSDHDVEEECLKIFQEYEPSDHPKGVTVKEAPKPEVDDEDVGRKRVAHPSAAASIVRAHGPTHPAKKIKNPQQLMYDRWRKMKEAAAEKAAEKAAAEKVAEKTAAAVNSKSTLPVETEKPVQKCAPPKLSELKIKPGDASSKGSHSESQLNGNGRIRIAHVPYAMSLALAKKKVNETVAKAAVEAKTAAQTTKGSRVAHIPQVVPQLVAPEPLQVTTQKFPLNVRQYYVNLMHVICVQIYTNGEDAGQRALREELACHDRCKALSVYKNSCMLAAHRLRKEVEQGMNGDESLPSASGIVSHNAVLAGKSKGSWSVEKTKKSVMDFRGTALYERLKKWIMSEQQLRDNGFPRSHPDGPKGRAKVYATNTRNHSILSKVPNERYCCRCNKPYMVNKHGLAVQQQNCIYHWGRKFTTRGESKYTCCQQYGFASGCADAKNHVWEYVDYENLRGYVKTLPKDIPAEEHGVYALDCEMCYTTQGLELTRVTVINEDCNTIYETLVMPENPIIDYNTRFSGITEESMKGVKTTILDVQATLLTMFSEFTILVGHSLESDFKALKLIHDTVVDTSMMFPHKNGPPHKRALRNLCSEYLRKIIQNEVGGHDSAEDAIACMDLIHWKVKEEAKLL